MDTLVTILLPLIVITYIVIDAITSRKQWEKKELKIESFLLSLKNEKLKFESFRLSLKTIDRTEGKAEKRKSENEYIEIGEQILNNSSFFDLNRDAINAIYNEEE